MLAPPDFNLTYSEEFLKYSLGPNHPMNPSRLGPSISLLNYLYSDDPDFKIINPSIVNPSIIELAHTKEYIASLNQMSIKGFEPTYEQTSHALTEFNIGTGDCPIFENMAGNPLYCVLTRGLSKHHKILIFSKRSPRKYRLSRCPRSLKL